MAEDSSLDPSVRHSNLDEFYRFLPDLDEQQLVWLIRSLGACGDSFPEMVSNWSIRLWGKELEDLDHDQLKLLAELIKARYEAVSGDDDTEIDLVE